MDGKSPKKPEKIKITKRGRLNVVEGLVFNLYKKQRTKESLLGPIQVIYFITEPRKGRRKAFVEFLEDKMRMYAWVPTRIDVSDIITKQSQNELS